MRRTLHLRGQTAFELGNVQQSRKQLREAARLAGGAGEEFSAASSLHALGDVELSDEGVEAAADAYEEALRIAWNGGADRLVCYSLAGLAAVAAERDQAEAAALLWGFVERYEEQLTFTLRRRSLYADRLDPAAEAHRDRWEAGRELDVGAAVGYALALAPD